jgi:MFS transporter, SHS family, lactate transporter
VQTLRVSINPRAGKIMTVPVDQVTSGLVPLPGATGISMPWWREPTRDQWLAWVAAWLGWMLDAFDFTIFFLLIVPISREFHVSLTGMATVVTLTLWMRLIGACASGWLADRVGRRTPLMISIAWFSVCQFIAGFSPSFTFLLVMRTLLGIGMGAEWPAGAALAMESWPARSRGRMSGLLQGSWGLGFLLASVAYGALFERIGWRGLFWIGVLPALLIVYIRRFVKEPEVWVENRRRQIEAKREVRSPFTRIFQAPLRRNTLTASWWMISGFVAYYAMNTLFAAHLEQNLHFTTAQVAFPIAAANLMYFLTAGFWGSLSDKLGRRWCGIIPGLVAIPLAAVYLTTNDPFIVTAGFILQGAFGQSMYWLYPVYLAERFPTEVRAAASAFCYHTGAIVGGAIPPVITLMASHNGTGLGTAMLIWTTIGSASFCLALFLGPETKGTEFRMEQAVT